MKATRTYKTPLVEPSSRSVRVDIHAVAKLAKVSIATVSRTMNNVPTVDRALAERVWKAAAELKYYPNPHARALVSGRSRVFGLLVPEITNPFFPELIQRFEEVSIKHGYEILLNSTRDEPERMKQCIRRMIERNVEGVAVMTFGAEDPVLEELASRNIPMVFIDVRRESFSADTLFVDYKTGMMEAVAHLAAFGHRAIGFISGPLQQHSAAIRHEVFLNSMAMAGLPVDTTWMAEGDHDLQGGMRGMEKILKSKKPVTAVMCSNDMTAIGALQVLLRHGKRVPEDVSLIGFDDIQLAEFVNPSLTTVSMSRTELAQYAFESLLAQTERPGRPLKGRRKQVSTQLVVRQSTAAVDDAESRPAGKKSAQKRAAALRR